MARGYCKNNLFLCVVDDPAAASTLYPLLLPVLPYYYSATVSFQIAHAAQYYQEYQFPSTGAPLLLDHAVENLSECRDVCGFLVPFARGLLEGVFFFAGAAGLLCSSQSSASMVEWFVRDARYTTYLRQFCWLGQSLWFDPGTCSIDGIGIDGRLELHCLASR